jgi:hypothetical protein
MRNHLVEFKSNAFRLGAIMVVEQTAAKIHLSVGFFRLRQFLFNRVYTQQINIDTGR